MTSVPKETIVQVHSRPDYFEYLIKSLRGAKGISDALIVVSHDLFSEEMNRLVGTIDFCKVSNSSVFCYLSYFPFKRFNVR